LRKAETTLPLYFRTGAALTSGIWTLSRIRKVLRNCTGPVALATLAAACTTSVDTNPPRAATEQLLIATAADRAAARLPFAALKGSKVFVDTADFEGYDSKYAVGAIKNALLVQGARLAASRDDADAVVEIRAGALSTNRKQTLVGIPSFNIPIPLASGFPFPEIAFYKEQTQEGVARFSVTSYDTKTGALIDSSQPRFGFSHKTKRTVFVFLSWTTNDILPETGG
jgi:hypothetical protein